MVLVTHHVEEIMPVFTNVLILKAGEILASGLVSEELNSKTLSAAFNAHVRLEIVPNSGGRKTLRHIS
jgi:iron complex transport system ATP-binding protein